MALFFTFFFFIKLLYDRIHGSIGRARCRSRDCHTTERSTYALALLFYDMRIGVRRRHQMQICLRKERRIEAYTTLRTAETRMP